MNPPKPPVYIGQHKMKVRCLYCPEPVIIAQSVRNLGACCPKHRTRRKTELQRARRAERRRTGKAILFQARKAQRKLALFGSAA